MLNGIGLIIKGKAVIASGFHMEDIGAIPITANYQI
jgi:hypothetical protein